MQLENFKAEESGLLLEECDEYLFEMASAYPRNRHKHQIMAAVNPTEDRIGECYFKVYDGQTYRLSKKVVRIDFFGPRMLKHRNSTKKHWSDTTKQDLKQINDFLDSECAEYNGVTVWEVLKYHWNIEKGFDITTIQNYMNGDFDDEFIDDPDYVPSVLESPDYTETKIAK